MTCFFLKELIIASMETAPNIYHAERLQAAIDQTDKNTIDIAFIDLNVPDSFGMETFLTYRKNFSHIPCVIMTGNDDLEMAMSAVKKRGPRTISRRDSSRKPTLPRRFGTLSGGTIY